MFTFSVRMHDCLLTLLTTSREPLRTGKFAAACIGCILFGIFTEFLGYLRRTVRTLLKARRAPEQIFVMCTLYALQLGFGYFCMLIAMTYQVHLSFLMFFIQSVVSPCT